MCRIILGSSHIIIRQPYKSNTVIRIITIKSVDHYDLCKISPENDHGLCCTLFARLVAGPHELNPTVAARGLLSSRQLGVKITDFTHFYPILSDIREN